MEKVKVAPTYDIKYLEIDRPSPLSDKYIESLIQDVLFGKMDSDISDTVYSDFKTEFNNYFKSSKLNHVTGLESFNRVDIINGCTQYIDNLYMQGPVQTVTGDYRYHSRLNLGYIKDVGSLIPDIPLIIAMPFPRTGNMHEQMQEILDEATRKNIDVHIDGAWLSCCRDIVFDYNHIRIKSVAISLSKGLGLGWNRVGLRYTREFKQDSITIMNDFRMNLRATVKIGLHFLRNLPVDYLWDKYGESYHKVCTDFNLTPTRSIYLALRDNEPVGVSPLIRYLNENG